MLPIQSRKTFGRWWSPSLLVEPKQPADTPPTSDVRQLFGWASRSHQATPTSAWSYAHSLHHVTTWLFPSICLSLYVRCVDLQHIFLLRLHLGLAIPVMIRHVCFDTCATNFIHPHSCLVHVPDFRISIFHTLLSLAIPCRHLLLSISVPRSHYNPPFFFSFRFIRDVILLGDFHLYIDIPCALHSRTLDHCSTFDKTITFIEPSDAWESE